MKKFTYKITAKNKNKFVFFSCVYNLKNICVPHDLQYVLQEEEKIFLTFLGVFVLFRYLNSGQMV